jgi:ABC transporter substrate binding protein
MDEGSPECGAITDRLSITIELLANRGANAIPRSAHAAKPADLPVPATFHRDLIVKLAARYRLPAVYAGRVYVSGGGLISYGSVRTDMLRRAASYVDRILRGAKPAELPVQFPTRFVMALNVKTAKALGLAVPPSILLRADEVIE